MMKIAILESIIMPAGHEVEFDRILVDELNRQGHTPIFFVPENFPFKLNYKAKTSYLQGGEVVSYAGANRVKRLYLSLLREKRRIAWFNSAFEKAVKGECDAIVIPTATYRYIKSLRRSKLVGSPVPVYIIFHGINPKEQPKFEREARRIKSNSQIHLKVITLRNDFEGKNLKNVDLIVPPVFSPNYVETKIKEQDDKEGNGKQIRIGFFGQFRKEKNLEFFLDAFQQAQFDIPVELIVQGSTAKPEDGILFEKISNKYRNVNGISFYHKNLIGEEWERALQSVDIVMMPYSAERYRYHWSAMLFTAIGFQKVVLVSPELNPEVLECYKIGENIKTDSVENCKKNLEEFVNNFAINKSRYRHDLLLANQKYSHQMFINALMK